MHCDYLFPEMNNFKISDENSSLNNISPYIVYSPLSKVSSDITLLTIPSGNTENINFFIETKDNNYSFIEIRMTSPIYNQHKYLSLNFDPAKNCYTGNFTFSSYAENGLWSIDLVSLYYLSSSTSNSSSSISSTGSNIQFIRYNINKSISTSNYLLNGKISDVSILTYTINSANQDITPSVLNSVIISGMTYSDTTTGYLYTVPANTNLNINVSATDNDSGMTNYLYCYFRNNDTGDTFSIKLNLQGAPSGGVYNYSGIQTFTTSLEKWRISNITIYDSAGNARYYQIDTNNSIRFYGFWENGTWTASTCPIINLEISN